MAKFFDSFVVYFFLIFLCYCRGSPVGSDNKFPHNELEDHGYLGFFTKSMPRSIMTFAIEMEKKLTQERPGENVLTSPLSAYAALLMLHLAAGETTRKELSQVLQLSESDPEYGKLHEVFGEILRKVGHRQVGSDESPEAIIANGFFVQKDRAIRESFLQSLRKYYDANATNVDFVEHAGEATDLINDWISTSTKHRIEKFYETPVPSTTVSILASALYFHGIWKDYFNKDLTAVEKFHTESGDVDVSMMHNQQVILHTYSDSLQFESIELPYKGGEYAMTIQLPRPSQTLRNMTDNAHLLDIQELNRNAKVVGVDYKIPKMKFSWKNSLVNALGLEDVFRNADLSQMTADKVPVSDMLQATEMEVDEQGTIASAATAISVTRHLTPPINTEKTFYANRPFAVAIIHKPTQMLLFHANIYKVTL